MRIRIDREELVTELVERVRNKMLGIKGVISHKITENSTTGRGATYQIPYWIEGERTFTEFKNKHALQMIRPKAYFKLSDISFTITNGHVIKTKSFYDPSHSGEGVVISTSEELEILAKVIIESIRVAEKAINDYTDILKDTKGLLAHIDPTAQHRREIFNHHILEQVKMSHHTFIFGDHEMYLEGDSSSMSEIALMLAFESISNKVFKEVNNGI